MIAKAEFGKTGHESTRTIFGAAALSSVSQQDADRTLQVLLKYGVNHIDVAASYGDAELRVGPWMPQYRDRFFLASKTGERSYQGAHDEIRRSLERLQTNRLDLIQLHAVTQDDELETVLGKDGALKAAVEARDEGLVRFIGITSHTLHAPAIHIKALEQFDFNSVLLPYNYPMMQNPQYSSDFNALAEICRQKGVAIQTIKSICRRPWPENKEHFADSWYEPLVEQEDVDRAVGFVFAGPQMFLNTIGDIQQLPRVLDAASRYIRPPQDAEMQAMAQKREMIPLWPEHAAAV